MLVGADHETLVDYSTIKLIFKVMKTESHPKSEEHGPLLGSLAIKEPNRSPHAI